MKNKNDDFIKTTDSNFELRFYNKKGFLNIALINKIGFSLFATIGVLIFIMVAEAQYFYYNVEDFKTIPELIISTKFQLYIIPEIGKWIWEEIHGLYSLEFFSAIFIAMILPSILTYKIVKWAKKKALIQSNLSSLNLSQYYLYKFDLKEDIYTFKLIKGETMNYDNFNSNRENLCQLFGYSSMTTKREGDNKIIVSFNRDFPKIEDKEIMELNKNIEKYNKDGYMTLGYSNISDENVEEARVGNLFIKYMPLKDLNIHIKLIGASGFGKSVNFATLLRNFMNMFNEIDTLFIHDFSGTESNRMTKFIEQSKQKEELENRIITSTTIEDIEDILIKLEIVFNYRMTVMNENDWLNYKGGKIIVMIDEFNIGMSGLESKNKFERKKVEQVERMLKDFAMLYRKANMYLIIVGQSNQVQDNFSSTLNKQTSIGFLLKSSTEIASRFNSEAYEQGIDASTFRKGEVLYSNQNNSTYFKFLSAYLDENFLFDMGEINITERQEIDNDMFNLAIQLKVKLTNERVKYYDKLLKSGDIGEEDYKKDLEDYNELLEKNIEEITNYIFLVKEDNKFSFVKKEDYNNEEAIEQEVIVEEIVEEVVENHLEKIEIKIDFKEIAKAKLEAKKKAREEESEKEIDNDKLEEAFNKFKEETDIEDEELEEMLEAKQELKLEEQFKSMEKLIKEAPDNKEDLKKPIEKSLLDTSLDLSDI